MSGLCNAVIWGPSSNKGAQDEVRAEFSPAFQIIEHNPNIIIISLTIGEAHKALGTT
jgi:hypothetical protein